MESGLNITFPCCPICAWNEAKNVGAADITQHPLYSASLPTRIYWQECTRCGHIYTRDYWTEKGFETVMKKSHSYQVAGNDDPEMLRQMWAPVVSMIVEEIEPEIPGRHIVDSTVSWLDIGCGSGALVMTASEFGFNATGLDARQVAVRALTERGYQAEHADIMHYQSQQPFNVISMMDVLEHLPNPLDILERTKSMLKVEGLLLISCPNRDSWSWREMDRRKQNPYWVELEHYHNFSRQSLTALLERFNFSPIRYGISLRYKAGMDMVFRLNRQAAA